MSKYYKADDVLRVLSDEYYSQGKAGNLSTWGAIRNLPTIEINEGEWVSTFSGVYMCSNCKESFVNIPEDGYFRPMWDFCPKCGAKMKGVK